MKGYRKLRVGEVIKQGDVFLDAYNNNKKESANFWAGTTIGDLHQDHYRPIKKQGKRYSYIARVTNGIGIYYVEIIGINGKLVFSSFEYSKRSYAIRQAKSFCSKVTGVKLEIMEG